MRYRIITTVPQSIAEEFGDEEEIVSRDELFPAFAYAGGKFSELMKDGWLVEEEFMLLGCVQWRLTKPNHGPIYIEVTEA